MFLQRSADTTTVIMTTNDDGGDLQDLNSKVHDSKKVQVCRKNHVRHITMDKQLIRLGVGDSVGGNTGVWSKSLQKKNK